MFSAQELCRYFGWSAQSLYDRRRRRFREGEHYIKKEYGRGAKKHKKLLFNLEAILATFKDDISFQSPSRNIDRSNLTITECQNLASISGWSPRTIQRLRDDDWYITYCLTHNKPLPREYVIESWRDAAIYYYRLKHKAQQQLKEHVSDNDILDQFAEQETREKSASSEYFTTDEFDDPTAISDLCQCIEHDHSNLQLSVRGRTLKWLNELLEVPDLYNRICRQSRLIVEEFPRNIENLTRKTVQCRAKCFKDLRWKEQQYIVRLNRLVIEKIYPHKIPKSLDKRISTLKRLIMRLPDVLNPTIKRNPRNIIFIRSKLRYLHDNVLIGRGEIANFLKISTAQLRQFRKNVPKNRKNIPIHVYGKTHYAFKHELTKFLLSLDEEIFLREQVDT